MFYLVQQGVALLPAELYQPAVEQVAQLLVQLGHVGEVRDGRAQREQVAQGRRLDLWSCEQGEGMSGQASPSLVLGRRLVRSKQPQPQSYLCGLELVMTSATSQRWRERGTRGESTAL